MLSRKSSARVTLVLIGVAALAGCGRAQEQRRDVYASREDCLADWGNKPEDCKPATEQRHASHGFWYGPVYPIPYGYSSSGFSRGSTRSIGSSGTGSQSSSVSRGGFGSSARSSGG
jgi:uncharacterized protein YgiB involved in biofilm formation